MYGDRVTRVAYYALNTKEKRYAHRFRLNEQPQVIDFDSEEPMNPDQFRPQRTEVAELARAACVRILRSASSLQDARRGERREPAHRRPSGNRVANSLPAA